LRELKRGEKVTEQRANEALEKLAQGIEESKQMFQERTMKLAQGFFGDSVEEIKQQIQENRSTLEDLPDQIPGGREESFQMLFQELMDNYAMIENALEEAERNVANLDLGKLREQGEVEASDAARRKAQELGVDLTQVEGSGSEGRIIVEDVTKAAEEQQEAEEPRASDAARRKAEELGIDLAEIKGSGSNGLITVKDVASLAESAQGQAEETAEQVAGEDGEGPQATNAARRKAEELGVDLSQIEGSGSGGLITIKDVLKA
jgi:pyruvate/2-oxoglutarate dehydrogenase complex dihydrolipoamide acyltransferase (E2) component